MALDVQKVLITGGFGAIGHNLTHHLTDRGWEVTVVDNLSSGVANFSHDVAFRYLDISNTERTRAFFDEYHPDLIFHLAAHFANQNSVDHPISDASTNVLGLINVFEAQRSNPNLRKVVYASSSCVYGNAADMSEATPVEPYDTPYAINKYVGELYCRYYSEIHGIPTACARIFNTYGPGEMPGAYRNVVPNFIRKALANEDIRITGTGDETRDFTFVADTVSLLVKIADSDFREAEVFNGGTGITTSIRTLAEAVIRLTGSRSQIVYAERRGWDHVQDRRSDVTRSKAELGYAPAVALEEGLARTIDWIRAQPIGAST